LGQDLFPCLTGLVTALLPGIEEEGSEFFEPVMKLLDDLCRITDRTLFFRAIWKSLLQSGHVRIPALNYLIARLPADKTAAGPHLFTLLLTSSPLLLSLLPPHLNLIFSPDMAQYVPDREGLVLRALITGLQDTNILVQRNTLEVITVHFKVHEK
jgi:hypothetical protein